VRFAESERRWLVPTLLVVLVAVALGVAGLLIRGSGTNLFGDPDESDTTDAPPSASEPVAIAQTVDFDPPPGDGREHASEAADGDAIDSDPSTSWSTERYQTPEFGSLKDGVGLILELEQPSELRSLQLDTPSEGWQTEVYVADSAPDRLEGWGEPVATFDSGTNPMEFEATGGAVLLWFTRAGNDGQVTLTEVRLQR
jgi:hypothetical protein